MNEIKLEDISTETATKKENKKNINYIKELSGIVWMLIIAGLTFYAIKTTNDFKWIWFALIGIIGM